MTETNVMISEEFGFPGFFLGKKKLYQFIFIENLWRDSDF